jgi:hypothetical protein
LTIVIDSLRRAAWGVLSLLYAALLLSSTRLPHVPIWLASVLILFAVACALRPSFGLLALAVAVPSASFLARHIGAGSIAWAEVLVVAAAAGWSARRTATRSTEHSVTADAAGVMIAVVVSAVAAAVGVRRIALGADAWSALFDVLTRTYFVELRGFPGLHAGMLLIEGMTLLACSRWIAAADRTALPRLAAALAGGAALAASVNVAVLVDEAAQRYAVWPALVRNLTHVRYNAHYGDVNAAGSFFVMCLVAALGAAMVARPGWHRRGLALLALVTALGVWTSGSRTAMVAAAFAAAVAIGWHLVRSRAPRLRTVVAVTLAAMALGAVAVSYLPARTTQSSASIAVAIRLGMIEAAGRMLRAHPLLGVGVGQFPERVGDFVSGALATRFPPAVRENAHNNFVQVAAELGLVGFAAFIAVVALAFLDAGRGLAHEPLRTAVCIALGAFLLTCIGGHPLLVPEAACAFWMLLGTAAGSPAARPAFALPRLRYAFAAVAVLALACTPLRVQALVANTNFEHLAIGVSPWQIAPDGTRYRVAIDGATLFVPANEAFAVEVQPIASAAVRIELRLDGRVADVVTLQPNAWQDMRLPARGVRVPAGYSRLQLRVVDGGSGTVLWISKVRPLGRPTAGVHSAG